MRLDDLRPSDNVDDRRGGFGGPGMAIGGGGLGLVAVVVISLLFGVDPSRLLNGGDPGAPLQRTGESGPRADNPSFQFARRVIGSAEDVWQPLLRANGRVFAPATLTVYDYETPTGCGEGQSAAGPFYCPTDRRIYLDLSFFNELAERFGAPGEFAQAYVIAHEYGHHIQNLTGVFEEHDDRGTGADSDSVRRELQADCYAGVWAYHANAQFRILQDGDVESGLRAASAVGDDTLQKETRGYAVPDSFTHGSSEQRVRWFKRGLADGDMNQCDTFSADAL
ncbi:MAG: neutral zinc metallopeptidase [Alphaproteobacteria bacterium]|nr:neutral zinc metallopeptidase [Alphaproteobacteria bacterium]